MLERLSRWRRQMPTLMHFTHARAGSTWIDCILRRLFAERTLPRFGTELFKGQSVSAPSLGGMDYAAIYTSLPAKPGHVYSGLMLTREEFLERPEFLDAKRFVVIRDLRDTLVRRYFSLRDEHPPDRYGREIEPRQRLLSVDLEGGLLDLIERDLARLVAIQRSWLTSGDIVVRFEDLLDDDVAAFEKLLLDRLELPLPRRHIRPAVEACRLGPNPPHKSHKGDWQQHFTRRVAEAFVQTAGNLLVASGYEPDSAWVEKLGASPPPKRAYSTATLIRSPAATPGEFTLIHLTHAKAGSSWIYRILRELFPERIAARGRKVAEATGGDLSKHVFAPARVYAAMFMRADEFDPHPELADALRFVVIRDLRDTLVSLYFSLKVSHPLDAEGKLQQERETLESLTKEDGLLRMMNTLNGVAELQRSWLGRDELRMMNTLNGVAELQRSWLGRDELFYRYEDLLPRGHTLLRELLIERFRLPITDKVLQSALGKYSFEARYGRKLGEEDASSHGRQGAPGNWRKHFTPRVTQAFAERFGELLIDTGYERNLDWATLPT